MQKKAVGNSKCDFNRTIFKAAKTRKLGNLLNDFI